MRLRVGVGEGVGGRVIAVVGFEGVVGEGGGGGWEDGMGIVVEGFGEG